MNWSCVLLNAALYKLEPRLINAAPISSPFFLFSFFLFFNIPQSRCLNHFKHGFGASGAAFGKNAAQTARWSCVCVKCSSNTTLKLRFCQTQLQNAAPCSIFCSVLIFQLNYIQFVVLVLECFEFFFQTFFFGVHCTGFQIVIWPILLFLCV